AKYETFPIWNLPLENPINIAYEAATADIGDYNVIDKFYVAAYGKNATNYNRDVDAYPILQKLVAQIASENNFMHSYKSPSDMGISSAGFCIEDMSACIAAAKEEIKRRIANYEQMVMTGNGKQEWVDR